jgi:hypothetical protein
MTPSEVLFNYKIAGSKIHLAGIAFSESKKPKSPDDAERLLKNAIRALEEAKTAVTRLL